MIIDFLITVKITLHSESNVSYSLNSLSLKVFIKVSQLDLLMPHS